MIEETPNVDVDISRILRKILKSPLKASIMAKRSADASKPHASKDIIKIIEEHLGETDDSY